MFKRDGETKKKGGGEGIAPKIEDNKQKLMQYRVGLINRTRKQDSMDGGRLR